MKKHEKAKRFSAFMLALMMALSAVAITPAMVVGETPDIEPVEVVEELSYGSEEAVYEASEELPPLLRPERPLLEGTFQADDAVGDEDGMFLPIELLTPEENDLFMPLFIGAPQAPRFSRPGGVHSAAFDLEIHGYGADVRFTTDGSIPVVCSHYPNAPHDNRPFTLTGVRGTAGSPAGWPAGNGPTCGCSPLLPAGASLPINYVVPSHANSPMSTHGVGRGNPGYWNVPWGTGNIEDSGYVTPISARTAHGNTGNVTVPITGANAPPAAGAGYYVANLIYNGVAIRARGFDITGEGGPVSTQTFIVNRAGMGWDNTRILSIVTTPEEFTHPILGMMRNWDRQLRRRSGPGSANPTVTAFTDWVSMGNFPLTDSPFRPDNWPDPMRERYPYDWPAQIEAGLWDGRNTAGADVPGVEGYGFTVRRNAAGVALPMGYQNLGPRTVANIEMFCETGDEIINQLGRTWVFGNWSRMFPIRSIRVNFNQGDGDVTGTPNLIPGTRRHFYAPNEMISNFRHINARTSDVEGTDLRDPMSMEIMHPLRPMIQNSAYGAVFVNGEFWGMYNLTTHRHSHLIGEMYGIPRGAIQLEGDNFVEDVANLYIIYPPTNTRTTLGCPRLGIAPGTIIPGRSVDVTAGTRRTALGADGYARMCGCCGNHDHLSREWFDFLNTVMCMDNFIDWFIAYYHLENWDWVNNNTEMWRTAYNLGTDPFTGEDIWGDPREFPGMYGADGRWRFITQDFDNAIFHGANNMLDYFTAMVGPDCPSGCELCGNSTPGFTRPPGPCRGEPLPGGLPFDILRNNSTWRRPERSARIFRVLFQNPYFRATFAARYSTYTGTVFHPARMMRIVDEQAALRSPTVGRHAHRWGVGHGAGTFIAPWVTPGTSLAADGTLATIPTASINNRRDVWMGVTSPLGERWPPHTLSGNPMGTAPVEGGGNPPPAGISTLRSQEAVLVLRAAPAGVTFTSSRGGSHGSTAQNSIEHMRAYFSRAYVNNPRPANQTVGSWGRENQGLTLGALGDYTRVNWQIQQGGAVSQDAGWLNVAGANIRADLFEWGNLVAYNTAVVGFPAFSIGSFSARYLQNMPIEVTANANPGHTFSHFTVTGGTATVRAGDLSIETGGQRQHATGATVSGNIAHETIVVTPSGTGAVTVTAHFSDAEPTAIIHQVYGQGTNDGINAVSHGFIELYNPSHTETVNLTGRSIQIQNIENGVPYNQTATDWEVLEFEAGTTIPPRHSFLIVSGEWYTTDARHVIEEYDLMWPDVEFSNRNFTVALVNGTAQLPPTGAANLSNIDDLVGAVNTPTGVPPRDTVHNVWGPGAARRISRSEAARRMWTDNEPDNTRNNYVDFEAIRFADINMGEIDHYRPRSLEDGAWPATLVGEPRQITIQGGGMGNRAFPNPAHQGQLVGLESGTPPVGQSFEGWTTTTPNITINNADSMTDAYFIMPTPAIPVTVRANFVERQLPPPTVIINQMHGQGVTGSWSNAISHGFIELYNPTANTINLADYTLQIMNDASGTWHVVNLPAHPMPPAGHYLVVSSNLRAPGLAGHTPRHVIENYDLDLAPFQFSHASLTAVLVRNHPGALSSPIAFEEWQNISDLVAARNETGDPVIDYLGSGPAMRMWRQGAARRRGGFQNTQDNQADFEAIDYRYPIGYSGASVGPALHANGITNAELEMLRPRWSGDVPGEGTVTIINGGIFGAGATPNPAEAGQTVTISAGYRGGYEFREWTVEAGGVVLASSTSNITTFEMPNPAVGVTVAAHWDVFYGVQVLNGHAPAGQSGAGMYDVGERVVIFAGTRTGGWFFDGWTGPDVNLLADPNSAITYFYMPARGVYFTATWYEADTDPDWPIHITGVRNNSVIPNHAEGAIRTGANSGSGAAGPWGNNGTPVAERTVMNIPVNSPGGTFTLVAKVGHYGHMDPPDRAMVFNIDQFGNFSSANPHAIFSLNPPSNQVYVSYGNALPPGHIPWEPPVELFQLTVNGTHNVPTGNGSLTGAGMFPEGHRAAINAGYRTDGQMFSHWTADPDVIIADPESAVTSFIMLDEDVTVTAHWRDAVAEGETLILNGGTGANAAPSPANEGATVTVNAGSRPTGFLGWEVVSGNVTLANPSEIETTFTMPTPAVGVILRANWEAIRTVTVHGGQQGSSGVQEHVAGETVTINAGTHPTAGYFFAGWSGPDAYLLGLDINNATATFTMPDRNVSFTADWAYRRVTVLQDHAPTGQSGDGVHVVGERVVIFAGDNPSLTHFFLAWTGSAADMALLELPANSPINYFYMPNRNVTFTATWQEQTGGGAPAFPVTLRLAVPPTHPTFTFGAVGAGTLSVFDTNTAPHLPVMNTADVSVVATEAGSFTFFMAPTSHNWGHQVIQLGEGRRIVATVNAAGEVSVSGAAWDFGNQSSPNTTVSHNTANVGRIAYITYGGIPTGNTAGSPPAALPIPTHQLTVVDSHAVIPSANGTLTGQGQFPAGNLVAINAGYRPGYQFTHWEVTAGTVTLANINNPITTFNMPASAVTVTAHWGMLDDPDVTWPTALTATFGQTLAAITLPTNVGTAGTFSWVPATTTPVGNAGENTFNLRFTPDDLTAYNIVTSPVTVTVNPATAPTLTFPTASGITEGQPLSNATLTGGSSTPAAGTWAWENGAYVPTASGNFYVVFTPTGVHADNFDWSAVEGYVNGTIRRQVSVTVTAAPELAARSVIIHQMYGRAFPGNEAVSRGFIELYNPTEDDIDLAGWSLQIQNLPNDHRPAAGGHPVTGRPAYPWRVIEFSEELTDTVMPSRTSILIVTSQSNEPGARYIIPAWDIEVTMAPAYGGPFSNRNFSAAIVNNTTQLSTSIADAELSSVVDLVGAWNTEFPRDRVENYLVAPAHRLSNQEAARRVWVAGSPRNDRNNSTDFAAVRYALDGMDATELAENRPRYSGDGPWPTDETTFALNPNPVTISDGNLSVTVGPTGSATGAITLGSWTPPLPAGVTATVVDNTIEVEGTRPAVGAADIDGTFTAIATREGVPVTITVNVNLTALPSGDVLVELIRPEANATAVNNTDAPNSHFVGTGGLFGNVSRLTAWDDNTQVLIGFAGANRTPVVFNNGSLVTGSTNWNPAHVVGYDNASAFQLRFPTTGFENIRFSATQKSTGSGPDSFFLAYRIGSTGSFTPIANSTRDPVRIGNDTYAALQPTFTEFVLPTTTHDEDVVYLRVVFNGLDNLGRGGNTSINDIIVRGDAIGGAPTFSLNPNPAAISDADTSVTVTAMGTATGAITLGSWTPPLPEGVTANVVDNTIVITGTRPAAGAADIDGAFHVTATREDVEITFTVNVNLTAVPSGDVLVELIRTETNATAVNYTDPANSHFVGTGGLFGDVSRLTAWDDNTQVLIGYAGDNRTPIVFNNASRVVHPGVWNPATIVGLDYAPAFQLSFPTTGHDNIRFSATQKSTGSGPDRFLLAYRVGSDGPFTLIPDTAVYPVRIGADTFAALQPTFTEFVLPATTHNQPVVYLRVVFDGLDNLTGGNTSINNIIVRGDEIPPVPTLTALTVANLELNQAQSATVTTAASVIAILNDVRQHATTATIINNTNPAITAADLAITWSFDDDPFDASPGATNVFNWSVTLPNGLVAATGVETSGTITVRNYDGQLTPVLLALSVSVDVGALPPGASVADILALLDAATPTVTPTIEHDTTPTIVPENWDITWTLEGTFDPAPGATNTFRWTITPPNGLDVPNVEILTGTIQLTNYSPETYLLTVTGGTGGGNFAAGASVTAVATVPSGYAFDGWTATGITTLTTEQLASASVTFNMPASDVTLVADFIRLRNLTILEGGTGRTPDGTHGVGATVNITPGTRANYGFDGWADVVGITIDPLATSFVMPDNDVSLTATWYSTITFPLTVTGGTGSGDFPAGASVTATATVPPGYEFDGWTADGVTLTTAQLASESVTFNMPATAVTLTANFEAIAYQLTILDGGIDRTPDGTHVAGATVNITPGTRDGYSFTGWTAVGVELTDPMATSFVMPAGAVTLTANWLAIPTLTAFSIDAVMLTEEIATAAEVIALLNDIAVVNAEIANGGSITVDDLNVEWSFVGEFTTSPGAVNVFTWTVTGPPGLVIPPELATGTTNVINFIDEPTLISVTVPPITAFTAPTDDAAAAIAALEAAAPYAQAVISTNAAPVDLEITWAVVGTFDPAPGATNTFTWTVTPPDGVFVPDGVATSGTITVTNYIPTVPVGDLTGNGRISIMDVALLRTFVVDGPDTLTASVLARIEAGAGNVSGNTPLSMTDVEMLRTYVMGMGHTLDPAVQARLAWHTAQ